MLGRNTAAPSVRRAELVNTYLRGVYGWMMLGLLVTAVCAFFTAASPAIQQVIFGNQFAFIGLIIAEFGLVMYLSARIANLSAGAATGLFLLYSALNGVTLSAILLVYASSTVFSAFFTAAGMFGAMSLYGMTTKRDLTSMGSFMMMGLFGIVIAMVVNIFIGSSMMQLVISAIGVIVFTGLTAYDTQRLAEMGESMPADDATAVRRGTILGALTLYLDFINLFLMLLRLFAASRD
ncbi:Bax inhibitor-1/YccA family protein [Halodesulfovibrio spirochaetisodalis]|uniref:Bax inhibitor-1/YccA family protein n=1 Tax=Halodesulfovibrio spirochaetisodalis TaxID=1560234 RepID=UPI00083435A8|nr:Bax inhibitor-1/YccA family protein [Halodesulfovibrio spirochaetisodalis]